MNATRTSKWEDACTAAAIVAVDPASIVGASLRSAPGPVRDRWLTVLAEMVSPGVRFHRVPLSICDGRLLGGLDLAATLKAGRPIAERGILATADGGIVMLAMAERLTAAAAGKICSALDTHEVKLEREGFGSRAKTRFAVVALDEGLDDEERPPQALLDRLAFHLDLNGVPLRTVTRAVQVDTAYSQRDVAAARERVNEVRVSDKMLVALCEAAGALGVDSGRAPLLALRVARVAAALQRRADVTEDDAALAARLVLGPRATRAPDRADPANTPERREAQQPGEQAGEAQPQDARPSDASPNDTGQNAQRPDSTDPGNSLSDRILEATKSALPPQLLAQLDPTSSTSRARNCGRSAGANQSSRLRGRPCGVSAGDPRNDARMNVIETLRAAAPWQRIRRKRSGSRRIRILKDDFRVTRFKRRNQTTTIFLVDASGSAAFNRLAEVKGAVELMLAESYVRRDRVALIAFRGAGATLLLSPTGSLVRAKRELASLPGGGGTPLASGLDAARTLAGTLRRRGESPAVVVLTDGRPNVGRDGKGGRIRAEADTVSAARMIRLDSIATLLVDTAPQPRTLTEQFAREMGAKYVPLPYADAGSLASIVNQW